ncbi:MAG: peptidoglycan-binding protein, partial [Clostridia bacterium]|nr:peptidoglycan-binding protein [Clostridia bacterium]
MKKSTKTVAIIATLCLLVSGLAVTVSLKQANVTEEPAVIVATYKVGSSGSTVKTIQRKLKNWGYYTGAVDGIYGSKTRAAVVYFQRRNGLVADGIVGNKTLVALGIKAGSSTTGGTTGGSFSSSDVYLLAKIIHAEARGESYTGQVAVGAVILNRVKNPSFPNTIAGVVYQKGAFTAVADGQINLAPNARSQRAA